MKISKKNHRQSKINKYCKSVKMIIISMLLMFSINSYAQINKNINTKVSNKTINNKNLNNFKPIRISKTTRKLSTINKNWNIKKLSKLSIPIDIRNTPSRKNVKITPKKPYHPYLRFEFTGRYTPEILKLESSHPNRTQATTSGFIYDYWLGLITFNAQKGKVYRLKIITTSTGAANKNYIGNVLVKIGNRDPVYSEISRQEHEIIVLFEPINNGGFYFQFSGVDPDIGKPNYISIKSIQVDEI